MQAVLAEFHGLMAWVSNVCPQVGPFTKMLWAALTSQPEMSWVCLKQIVTPLQWLRAFTASQGGPLQRHFRSRSPFTTMITFDGSPVGGGAFRQLAMPKEAPRTAHPIAYHWSTKWSHQDAKLLDAEIGSCRSQARWEAYALLRAVITWLPVLTVSESQSSFCGDALGVLQDVTAFRARDSQLNLIMGELALRLAPLGLEISVVHACSEYNTVCDALSRVDTDADSMPRLCSSARSLDVRPSWLLLREQ